MLQGHASSNDESWCFDFKFKSGMQATYKLHSVQLVIMPYWFGTPQSALRGSTVYARLWDNVAVSLIVFKEGRKSYRGWCLRILFQRVLQAVAAGGRALSVRQALNEEARRGDKTGTTGSRLSMRCLASSG